VEYALDAILSHSRAEHEVVGNKAICEHDEFLEENAALPLCENDTDYNMVKRLLCITTLMLTVRVMLMMTHRAPGPAVMIMTRIQAIRTRMNFPQIEVPGSKKLLRACPIGSFNSYSASNAIGGVPSAARRDHC